MHEAFLRTCESPSLNTFLKEQAWTEGQDRVIDWEEHDGPTIERFVTWLYREDYSAPDPQPRQGTGNCTNDTGPDYTVVSKPTDEPVADCVAEPEVEPEVGFIVDPVVEAVHPPAALPVPDVAQQTEQDVTQPPDQWPREDSHAMQHVIAESCDGGPLTPINSCLAVGLPEECQTREAGIFAQNQFPHSSHRYDQVLLAHARLYTFSVYHQIKSLQDLSLQRLTQVLARIDCSQPSAASEIATLVQHVYRDTLPAIYSKDAARKLVSQFVAMNFDELVHGQFETLLEEGGDFVLDLSRKVSRYVRSAKNSALLTEEHTRELESEVQRLKEEVQQLKAVSGPQSTWAFSSSKPRKHIR